MRNRRANHNRNESEGRTGWVIVAASTVLVAFGGGDAQAQTTMKAKDDYLKKLQSNTWPAFSPSTQYFQWPKDNTVPFPNASKRTFGTKTDLTRVGDGDCVTFVKKISNLPDLATSQWRTGTKIVQKGKVVSGISAGTIIATFDSTKDGLRYASSVRHAAVFARRVDDNTIEVYDQNWLVDPNDFSIRLGLVGRHKRLRIGGPDEANLERFYVVVKP